ncbi:MAG: TolC family protein, partial [Fusobacteriaceae bacterium]|nr:TolC family protein [Fusobacteriaceae bacterium]
TKDTELKLSTDLKNLDIQIDKNRLSRDTIKNNLSLLTGMRYKNEIHNLLDDVLMDEKEKENSILFKEIFMPSEISSEVVRYRPDIKYYLKMIDSQKETLTSLKADFYPQIKLQGDFGFEAIDPSNPFNKNSQFGMWGVGLYLPIFNSGAIKANYKLGGVDLNIFIEDYNKALLTAFNDINNEMLDTKNSKKSLELSKEKFIYETEIYKLALDRKEKGYISENNLLNSEYSFIEKSLDLLNSEYSLYNQQLKLIGSVGGVLENK